MSIHTDIGGMEVRYHTAAGMIMIMRRALSYRTVYFIYICSIYYRVADFANSNSSRNWYMHTHIYI